jgi:hypothetical protein
MWKMPLDYFHGTKEKLKRDKEGMGKIQTI